MSFNLIIPVAADRPEYDLKKPYWMDIHPAGNLMLYETISGFKLEQFDKIYITMLKKHVEQYQFDNFINRQFEELGLRNKLKLVLLDASTRNQPETVAQTIQKENIQGGIVIKDADNRFECDIKPGNFVCTYPLDALKNVNPADKSYISIDDNSFITNIVEKKIISRWFCCGAYGFEESYLFLEYFKKYEKLDKLFISHLIYAMLLDKVIFHPVGISNYTDWGSVREWQAYKNKYQTLFIPLHTIVENQDCIPAINLLYDSGKYNIILLQEDNTFTNDQHKNCLEELKYHQLILLPYYGNYSLLCLKEEITELIKKL